MEARQHLLAQVVVVTQRTPAPAYNAMAVSRDRAGLQQGGQLTRLRPAYNVTDNLPVRPRGRLGVRVAYRSCD